MSSVSLNIGLRALLTAQSALDTVGHNISNADTEGYSRQDLQVSAARPSTLRGLQIGGGVEGTIVLRTVDELLTKRISGQVSSVSRLDSLLTGMSGVEALLGEPNGFGLSRLLDDFFATVSNLSTNTEDFVFRTGVTQAATSLTSQFHQLADELGQLREDAAERVEFFANEVNVRSEQILNLNKEIAKVEATGVVANDLRDQRDLALRELSKQINITYHEDDRGAVRVLVNGQLLVGPTTTNALMADIGLDGSVTLTVQGGTQPVEATGGEIAGLIAFAQDFVPAFQADVDTLAHDLILEMNRVHSTGITSAGGFQNLSGSLALQDVDGDGSRLDELLSNAGLPFDVQAGEVYVHVRDVATDTVFTHIIDVDPERMTVGDLIGAINDIGELSANLDSFGRIQINADSGHLFDFSRRLNLEPDVYGSFGSGRASYGSANMAPFNIVAGSTLTLTGPSSTFTVTFDPAGFNDPSEATAAEVAAAINADPAMGANLLRAVAVGDQLFLQTIGEGATETFTIDGGTSLAELGFTAGTAVAGHDTGVDVAVTGKYTGAVNQLYVFRPNMDGLIGTTAGLQVTVETKDGLPVATLDVGSNYIPGTAIPVADGISVSFTFGALSATDNDAFVEHVIADSDTADLLVALGMNSLFEGTNAESFELRADIVVDPGLIAASATGAEGDNGILLDIMALQQEPVESLDGTFGEFYGAIIGGVGFQISSTQNSKEVEEFLVDTLIARREQISGVNVDEELVDMIQFEQAFGAASRFIQVINTLNDEILNLL